MNTQHTPGRLTIDDAYTRIAKAADGIDIFLTHEYGNAEANARRLVACWNACEGISTEALEKMPRPFGDLLSKPYKPTAKRGWYEIDELAEAKTQRDELLEALKEVFELYVPTKDINSVAASARAVIAKAEGEHS